MKKKISYKILFLAIVIVSSHLTVTSVSADEKPDRIKNISEQNSNQDTNAGKSNEKMLENEKEFEDNIDDEDESDEEETEPKKPKKEKVTLVENYKEEYKTYEEIMGDEHFFYSSVGNGGWTDKKVHIEFPAKMKIKIKKDGVAYKYVKGKDFTKRGTYFFTLEVKESKDKILTANFHFRIQQKPKKTPEELKAEEELNNREDLSKIAEYVIEKD